MSYTSKPFISSIILILVLASIGYILSSRLSEEKGESSNQGSVSSHQSGNSNTGTNTTDPAWGGNPFSTEPVNTGTTNTGEVVTSTTKPVFKKPSTEWKTRTLSGVTYRFGEGNPQAVALDPVHVAAYLEVVSPKNEYGDYGYVTSEIENLLYRFVSHPNWEPLVNCFGPVISPSKNQNTGYPLRIADVMDPGLIDMEHLLIVSPETGRKELNTRVLIPLVWFLRDAAYPPETLPEEVVLHACKERYGSELYRISEEFLKKYAHF